MGELQIWFEGHGRLVLLVGVAILVLGIALKAVGRQRRNITTGNRSVTVGRDNTGTIMTGDIGHGKDPGNNDLLNIAGSWASIVGLLLSIIAIVPMVLNWIRPLDK
jgi:uncharacterized membrane protein